METMKIPLSVRSRQRVADRRGIKGIALIEVMVSIILLSMGVIALMGLQASMNANAVQSKYRAEAAYLANQLLGGIWVDQANIANYAIASGACTAGSYTNCTNWLALVGRRLPAGSATVAINGSVVTITVTWQSSGGEPHNYLLTANVTS